VVLRATILQHAGIRGTVFFLRNTSKFGRGYAGAQLRFDPHVRLFARDVVLQRLGNGATGPTFVTTLVAFQYVHV
jgi:hypothetical protein